MLGVTKRADRPLYRRGFRLSRDGVRASLVEVSTLFCITGYECTPNRGHALGYWTARICVWSGGGPAAGDYRGCRCYHWPMKFPRATGRECRRKAISAARHLGKLLGCRVEIAPC